MKSREELTLNTLAKDGKLPPIDWHLLNLQQILHHLIILYAPDCDQFQSSINNCGFIYTAFLNSFDKADRIAKLAALHDQSIFIVQFIKNNIDLGLYAKKCIPCYEIKKITFELVNPERNYQPSAHYINECLSKIKALHDFALGLAATAVHTNAEPEKQIYKQLEQLT